MSITRMSSANDTSSLPRAHLLLLLRFHMEGRLTRVQQDGNHAITLQTGLLYGYLGGLQPQKHGVQTKDIALYMARQLYPPEQLFYLLHVVGLEIGRHGGKELGLQRIDLAGLFLGECRLAHILFSYQLLWFRFRSTFCGSLFAHGDSYKSPQSYNFFPQLFLQLRKSSYICDLNTINVLLNLKI